MVDGNYKTLLILPVVVCIVVVVFGSECLMRYSYPRIPDQAGKGYSSI